jgi:hypothetical protein
MKTLLKNTIILISTVAILVIGLFANPGCVKVLQFFSLLFLMLVTGIFWGPWFALSRSMHVFSAMEFLKIARTMAKNLGRGMQIMMPFSILATAVSAWCYPQPDSLGAYLSMASVLFIVVSLVITMTVELPAVKKIVRWSADTLPANWEKIRDRWVYYHLFRVLAAFLSFASFTAALIYLQF